MTPSIEPGDDQIRTALRDAFPEGPPTSTTQLEHQVERRVHRRAQRRLATRGAAVLTALTIVIAVIAVGRSGDHEAGVVTAPPESTGFGAWGPGWHQFDTGPVPGAADTATAWTGDELIVAAGRDTFAYNPTDRAWRALGALPFGDDRSPELVAAGNHVVAITTQEPDDQTPPEAATIDPRVATGWVEIDGPSLSPEMAAAWSITSVTSMRRPALVWTEQQVVDVGHGAVLDPDGWTWTPLPLPSDLESFAPVLGSNPVFDGSEVVLAAATSLPSLGWDARGSELREIPGIPTEPLNAGGTPGWSSAVSPTPGTVVVATADLVGDPADSMVWNLDTSTDTWTQLPKLAAMGPWIGCPNNAAEVGGRVLMAGCSGPDPGDSDIFELTGETWTGTSWSEVSPGTMPGWLGGATWQSTDDALVVWSNTDFGTADGGQSETDAWVWVPSAEEEPTTTTSTTPPADTLVPPMGFATLEPGWHQVDTGPVPASSSRALAWTGQELIVAADLDTYALEPATGRWRNLGALPFTEYARPGLAWTGEVVVAVSYGSNGAEPEAAILDPDADASWSPIEGPQLAEPLRAVGATGPPSNRSFGGVALVWTGQRVLDMTHGAVLDPSTRTWSALPLPTDLLQFGQLGQTPPVWDGAEVVLTSGSTQPGLAWNATGTSYRELPGIPESLVPIPGVNADSVIISPAPGTVILFVGEDDLSGRSNTLRLDVRSGIWTAGDASPGMTSTDGCPSNAAAVGSVVVLAECWDTSPGGINASVGGAWFDTNEPNERTTYGTWLAADGVLVAWASDTDTSNNPDAPYVEAWIWIPPAD